MPNVRAASQYRTPSCPDRLPGRRSEWKLSVSQAGPALLVYSQFSPVFVTALGHDAAAMNSAGFISSLQRGSEWAATGSELSTEYPNGVDVFLNSLRCKRRRGEGFEKRPKM